MPAPDVRISVLVPNGTSCLARDISGDLTGGKLSYEDTPGGCGAGQLDLGLYFETAFLRGYYTALNIVEISTGDDALQEPISAGATKLYCGSTLPYDPAQGEDTQQVYLWDGVTLTMGIPVTGVGTDGGGPYITVGTPLTMPGNPATIPAYGAGTVLGRRRYAGVIRQRQRPNQKVPDGTIRLGPVSSAFSEVIDSYSIGAYSNVDVTSVIYQFLLNAPASRWPQLSISAGNFAAMTGTTFSGSRTQATIAQMITDALNAIGSITTSTTAPTSAGANTAIPVTAGTGTEFGVGATVTIGAGADQENCVVTAVAANSITVAQTVYAHASGEAVTCASPDQWFVRVGHDRKPRMVRLYTGATNTYTYNLTLTQGTRAFEPQLVDITDQDSTTFYNAILVYGNTNPATQQPYSAYVIDQASVNLIGRQIDGPPTTNTALNSQAACAAYGLGLLDQYSLGQMRGTFRVYTRNDQTPDVMPQGLANGDVVRGIQCVTIAGFTGAEIETESGLLLEAESGAILTTEGVGGIDSPNQYGLVSSVVSTIDFSTGDRWQDVSFAPIEPDWSAAAREQANAAATALQANTATGASIASYSVSAGAFPPAISTSSLVVGISTFLALFASGSAPIVINANTSAFTLPPNANTWVWLTPGGTWVLQGTPSTLAGDILYGVFTTSATGVLGYTQLASIGVVQLSQNQLPSMGSEATASPIVTPSSPMITYPVIGNGTYDAEATFSVDLDLATAPWMVGLALFAVAAGDVVDDPRDFPFGVIPCAQWSGFSVTAIWTGIGAGNSKDLYVAYQDGQGRLSLATKIGATSVNQAGATALLGVPTTAPNPSSGPSGFTYAAVGASTYDASATIHLDTSGTTANNALAEIEVVIAPHASGLSSLSAGWTPAGSPQLVNGSGTYTVAAGGLGSGTAYDFGVRYVGQNGTRSYVYIVGTTAANPQVLSNLPSMGAQAAPVLSSVSGPTYPVVGGGTFDAEYTFTVDVHSANWLTGVELFAIVTGSGAAVLQSPVGFISVNQSAAGVYTATWRGIGASASTTYDLYVAYVDGQGVFSPATKVGTTVANPAGTSALASLGTTAPVATSSLPPTFAYYASGGTTYDVDGISVTLNSAGTNTNNALAELECVMAPHSRGLGSASAGWTPTGAPIAPNGSGTYTFTWGGCGAGTTYDVGIRYVSQNGARTNVLIIGTTSANAMALAALPSMGGQGAPVLTNVQPPIYPVVGNATFDAQVLFTVDVASAAWLTGIAIFALPHGSSANPLLSPYGFIAVSQQIGVFTKLDTESGLGLTTEAGVQIITDPTLGSYRATWPGLGASNSATYDLYVAYEDAQGNFSPAALVATTTANPAGTTAFGLVGTTAPNPSSGPSAFAYAAVGASTYDASCTISLDANGTAANNALAELEVVIAPHASGLGSTSTGWTPVGTVIAKNNTGVYVIAAGGLGSGTAYDVGVRYVGHTGDRSGVYVVGTTAANPQVLANLPSMGSQAAPVVTGLSGPTYPVVGNATFDASATFTVDVHSTNWLVGIALFAAKAGTAAAAALSTPIGFVAVGQSNGAGVYSATWPQLGASQSTTYDLWVAYQDAQGAFSPGTKVATTAANAAGTTALLGVPTTAPNPSSSPSSFVYAVNGGGTYDAEGTVNLDSNGTTANNGLAEIECVMAPHASGLGSTSNGWAPAGVPQLVNGTGVYVCAWGGCGAQVAYDVGVRYVGQNGTRSYVYIVGTTTAQQLAQIPFTGAAVDPATGYIVISDQSVYPTSQSYQLSAAGVGSMLSASWSAKRGGAVAFAIWLFYTASSGGNGYLAYWYEGNGNVYIAKVTAGSVSNVANSSAYTLDTTNFHNMEFIASETTSGTVNLTAIIDGQIACSYADSSSPYTSGAIAAQFRDASATNYIDEKTILIESGGSPSSSGLKAQGSILATSVPAATCEENTGLSGIGLVPNSSSFVISATTLYYSDGTSIAYGGSSAIFFDSPATGTWYWSLGIPLASITGASGSDVYVQYHSQTAMTNAQIAAFAKDGILVICINAQVVIPSSNSDVRLNIPGAYTRPAI